MRAIRIFYCYSPQDKALLEKLEEQLSPMKRLGKIATWSDYEIQAGMDLEKVYDDHLRLADIILLLVSPSFISSDFCYSVQMQKVLEWKDPVIIPIILRPTLWEETPIGKLKALPKNNKPVTLWRNRDAAFLDVTIEIWAVIKYRLQQAYESEDWERGKRFKPAERDSSLDEVQAFVKMIKMNLLQKADSFSGHELYEEWKEKILNP
jgi:TIR domain